jgi:predicted DNA-binding antitoxin AbrB/MazE fold protein
MDRVIEVVYENGVFKPLRRVEFKEGEILKVEIKGKVVTDKFYEKLERLKEKVERIEGAYKVLEEMRDDRY